MTRRDSASVSTDETETRLIELREAWRSLNKAETSRKNLALQTVATQIAQNRSKLLAANQADLEALPKQTTSAFRDRLELNEERLKNLIEGLEQVSALEDPLGEAVEEKRLGNGLELRRVRAALGVLFLIFESRPNVAIESFALAFKSGNGLILRGGSESMRTVGVLYSAIKTALEETGFDPNVVWGITDADRGIISTLLKSQKWIDVVIPRGGEGLIKFVQENSAIPILKNDRGLCHTYVHEDADLEMALNIVENAKVHRPGVCNSLETVLVHQKIAAGFLPQLALRLEKHHVQWFGCSRTCSVLKGRKDLSLAQEQNWDTEYLDYKINCRIVNDLEEALAHIEKHGSRHSEAIVTASHAAAARFQAEVDAAVVYWNASTRFTDGFEFGLGGEIGISTQKLHVRGPIGLRELTSSRWIIKGTGQIRS
ncbi:MAG: glutamate-5-semialdehyde dehydrogenase [Bdellovibrionota bacterium]